MSAHGEQDSDGEMAGGYESEFDFEALEEGADTPAIGEDSFEERLRAATKAIKSKRRYVDRGDTKDFLDEFGDIAGKLSPKVAKNLLHALVEVVQHTDEIEASDVELLVRQLVWDYPHLLTLSNKDGHNPLFMATRNSQHELVKYMLSTCLQSDEGSDGGEERATFDDSFSQTDQRRDHLMYLDEALCQTAQEGKTCLHIALKENIDADTTRMLIENASDDALAIQDIFGKTLMHYAVAFPHCNDERAHIIDLLIQRDLRIVQGKSPPRHSFLDLSDKSGSSVYREHEKTRAAITKKYNDWAKRRTLEDSKRDADGGPSGPTDKLQAKDPRFIGGTKESTSRQSAAAKSGGERDRDRALDRDRAIRDGKANNVLDERELLRQKKKAEEAAKLKDGQLPGRPDLRDDLRNTAGRDASRTRSSQIADADRGSTQLAIQTRNAAQKTEPAPNTPIKRTNTARFDAKEKEKEKEKEARKKQATRPAVSSKKSGNIHVWNKNSGEILLNMKLHYMRTRNEEMVISFLYGTNMDDVQISFDYDRLPQKIVWNDFTKRFGEDTGSGIKFDRVLQYVSIPHVEVGLRGRRADLEREAEIQTGVRQLGALGRKDMKYFFAWLYAKGVRHIINLAVEDTGNANDTVHSDQAIQESLERFIIEHLDWRKVDLDPETILHVSSKAFDQENPGPKGSNEDALGLNRHLKQLNLRWSGSNAVLRAWSEREGLAMLPGLEKIYLFKPGPDKVYDNIQWINKRIGEFHIRLNENRKAIKEARKPANDDVAARRDDPSFEETAFGDVEVHATDLRTEQEGNVSSRDTAHLTSSVPIKGVNSHRWLNSTARFAEEMKPFWDDTVKDFLLSRQNKGTVERVEDDVVVALIDDGVDIFDTPYSNQVLEGKSFDFHNGKVRPPFSSAKGHGTVMANMILRICPMAKVYPIRLRTFENPNGKNTIDKDYAAQAIQAALDKKATIISMSWTLPMSQDKSDSKAKDRLHAVLAKAVEKKDVLMFCSAPDEGKFTELDYPSGPWRDRFFRIGAAGADGKVFQWTPDVGITYVLPGVDVVKDQVGNRTFDTPSSSRGVTNRVTEVKYETGSSVATALAAGLAAMIIYCVKASILSIKTVNQNKGDVVVMPIYDDAATLIADPDAMKRAFAKLGNVTSNGFIQVWEELDHVSKLLEAWNRTRSSQPEARLKFIQEFTEFGLKLANSIKQ